MVLVVAAAGAGVGGGGGGRGGYRVPARTPTAATDANPHPWAHNESAANPPASGGGGNGGGGGGASGGGGGGGRGEQDTANRRTERANGTPVPQDTRCN